MPDLIGHPNNTTSPVVYYRGGFYDTGTPRSNNGLKVTELFPNIDNLMGLPYTSAVFVAFFAQAVFGKFTLLD